MAFQGEYFVDRYGAKQAERTPPIRRMLEMGVPVGAGTDATRVASYNPWVALYWLVTGKTVGGTALYPESNRLERMEALRLYTVGSSWFSSDDGKKGAIARRPVGRPGGPLRGLFFHSGRADQAARIGADDRRRQGRVRGSAVRPSSPRRNCRWRRIGLRLKVMAAIGLPHN